MAGKKDGQGWVIVGGLILAGLFLGGGKRNGGGGGGFGEFFGGGGSSGGFPLPAAGISTGAAAGNIAQADEDIGVVSPDAASQSAQAITTRFRSPIGTVTGPLPQPIATRGTIAGALGGVTRGVPVPMASQEFAASQTQFRNTLGDISFRQLASGVRGIQAPSRTQEAAAAKTEFRSPTGGLSFNLGSATVTSSRETTRSKDRDDRNGGTTSGRQKSSRSQASQSRSTERRSSTGRSTGPRDL